MVLLAQGYKNRGCHRAKGSPITIASWLLVICSVGNRSTLAQSSGLVGPLPLRRILQEPLSTWDVNGPLFFIADPRRLFVRFDGALAITLVAAHAPCLSDHNNRDEVEEWWKDFAVLCQRFEDGNGVQFAALMPMRPWLLMRPPLYGCAGAEKVNKQTTWFQMFLDQVKFAAPATLGFHVGPQHTWTHPKQNKFAA